MEFCGVRHFLHVLARGPERRPVSDEELLERLRFIHTPAEVALIALQLQDFRKQGQDQAAEDLKARLNKPRGHNRSPAVCPTSLQAGGVGNSVHDFRFHCIHAELVNCIG